MAKKKKECIEFGYAVRRLREEKGLTQETLAEKIDIHRTYIGGIERGERNPTLSVTHKISKALGVKPSRLLTD